MTEKEIQDIEKRLAQADAQLFSPQEVAALVTELRRLQAGKIDRRTGPTEELERLRAAVVCLEDEFNREYGATAGSKLREVLRPSRVAGSAADPTPPLSRARE